MPPVIKGATLRVTQSLKGTDEYLEALQRWRVKVRDKVAKDVEANLSGGMLKAPKMLAKVRRKTKLLKTGFEMRAASPALKAWTRGVWRKRFEVEPKEKKAMRVGTGFSRGHRIPRWRFPKKPVFEDALTKNMAFSQDVLDNEMITATWEFIANRAKAAGLELIRG